MEMPKIDLEDKAKIIQLLKTVYCRYYAEDKVDGTAFDIFVMESLDNIVKHHKDQTG